MDTRLHAQSFFFHMNLFFPAEGAKDGHMEFEYMELMLSEVGKRSRSRSQHVYPFDVVIAIRTSSLFVQGGGGRTHLLLALVV